MTAAARVGHGARVVLMSAAAVVSGVMFGAAHARAAPVSVLAGHEFVTTVPGFAPGAVVERRLDNVRLPDAARADRTGAVRLRLPAPTALGRHRLQLIGAVEAEKDTSTAGDVPLGGDPQPVVVAVPRVVTVDLLVVADLGVDAVDTSRGHRGDLGTAGESATAATGTNLVLPALAGVALVLLGGVLTAFGRRSRSS